MTDYRERTYVTNDGLRLFYRDYHGDSARLPVLCLPGLTRNSRDFAFIAAHLAPTRRVICADLRGRGRSQYDPNWRNYAIAMEVADTARLLDAAGIEHVIVLGTSRGGIVGMSLSTLPGVVAGLILNDIGAEVEAAGMERLRNSVGREPSHASWGEAALFLRQRYGAMYPDLGMEEWCDFARAGRREENGRIVPDYDPALGEATRFGRNFGRLPGGNVNLWSLFENIASRPVLLIHGTLSDILSAATVEKMRAMKPDLAVVTLYNRGHIPLLNEAECVAAIDAFLERVP
jgi:pimeloyl-ACP methyl ester carboxylesterase